MLLEISNIGDLEYFEDLQFYLQFFGDLQNFGDLLNLSIISTKINPFTTRGFGGYVAATAQVLAPNVRTSLGSDDKLYPLSPRNTDVCPNL